MFASSQAHMMKRFATSGGGGGAVSVSSAGWLSASGASAFHNSATVPNSKNPSNLSLGLRPRAHHAETAGSLIGEAMMSYDVRSYRASHTFGVVATEVI